jgi:hypothetical protein
MLSTASDMVLVTEAADEISISWAQANLLAGEAFSYPDFQGSGQNLTIHVCSMEYDQDVDYAVLSIFIADGVQKSTCQNATLEQQMPSPSTKAPDDLSDTENDAVNATDSPVSTPTLSPKIMK